MAWVAISSIQEATPGDGPVVDESSASILVGASLAIVGLAMATLVMALGKYWIPERNNFFARWGFTSLTAVVLVFIAMMLIVPNVTGAIMGDEPSFVSGLIQMGLIFLAPAIMIFRYAKRLDPDGPGCLGFRVEGSGRAAAFGLVAYLLLLPGLWGAMMLWPSLYEMLGGTPQAQDVLKGFFELEGGELIIPVILAVLILPFFEELLFRSFLQPLLVQNFREVGGVVVTSLLFAALHGPQAGPVFVLSLILGGVMQRSQRFSSCYLVHAVHNGLTLWLLLSFPEMREFSEASGLLYLF